MLSLLSVRRFLLCVFLLAATDAAAASKVCYLPEGDSGIGLRRSPSMHSTPTFDVDDGAELTVLAAGARFTRVRDASGRTGWISTANVCDADEVVDGADKARWRNPIDGACVTSLFGPRRRPTAGASTNHKGCDFGGGCGTPVKSAAPGRVIAAGWGGGFGKRVIVEHADGSQSLYAHFRKINVTPGTVLTPDSVLGEVGTTGVSTGCHLHLEISKNGRRIDPQSLIGAGRCPRTGRSSGSSWDVGTPR